MSSIAIVSMHEPSDRFPIAASATHPRLKRAIEPHPVLSKHNLRREHSMKG
jgi:hypothetical protein